MTRKTEARSLTRAASACLPLAPIFLLAGDILQILKGFDFELTLLLWISFVLFLPALGLLTYRALAAGQALAWAAGAFALIGTVAGASMQVLFRVIAVLNEAGAGAGVEVLENSGKLAQTTLMPGIFFPLGLLTLAIALSRGKVISAPAALLLAAGAILFPVGHAVGVPAALILGDLVLVLAFWLIYRQVKSHPREQPAVQPALA